MHCSENFCYQYDNCGLREVATQGHNEKYTFFKLRSSHQRCSVKKAF